MITDLILRSILSWIVKSQLVYLSTIETSGQRHVVWAKSNKEHKMEPSQSKYWWSINNTACSNLSTEQEVHKQFGLTHFQINNHLENY